MSKVLDAIKRAFAWIRKIFEDGDGIPSSKRIQSYILTAFALIVAVTVKDPIITGVILGAALGLQGITAFQR
jgi:hypothetical protein